MKGSGSAIKIGAKNEWHSVLLVHLILLLCVHQDENTDVSGPCVCFIGNQPG